MASHHPPKHVVDRHDVDSLGQILCDDLSEYIQAQKSVFGEQNRHLNLIGKDSTIFSARAIITGILYCRLKLILYDLLDGETLIFGEQCRG